MTTTTDSWELRAYRLSASAATPVCAPVQRDWMVHSADHFATRCLPMMMANQAGWFIPNEFPVRLTWNGSAGRNAVKVEYGRRPPADLPVVSYFGRGIVTWRIALLFRTPQNFDLWVRGPANRPKRGVYALEGIVETNWSAAPFTMNWQLMTPEEPVIFDEGEPIAMVTPIRKDDLERFIPVVGPIDQDAEMMRAVKAWNAKRLEFVVEREPGAFQSDYTRGRGSGDEIADRHKTRMRLRPFEERLPQSP